MLNVFSHIVSVLAQAHVCACVVSLSIYAWFEYQINRFRLYINI